MWKPGALDRKLLRDLWHLRGQVLAVAAVVACGVGLFVTMRGMYEMLIRERAVYYQQYRFADVFATVKRAPESMAERILALPGVQQVQTGIVLEVTLDVPGLAEPATGLLSSIPDRGPPKLNELHLRRGRMIEPGARDEVVVNEAFARANRLEPGSRLAAVINGRWQRLHVVGVANSPEYIYVLRPASGLPDDKRYGILWMGREAVAHAYDMDGAFNRVVLSLARGASEREVIDGLDRLLARYGSLGAHGRDDHLSHKVISDEINQDKIYGFLVSGIFLSVAAFIINIVLTRLVATQRDQVAVLKAFGYSNRDVGLHYAKLALAAALIGAAAAQPVALALGGMLADLYRDFFYFPHLEWTPTPAGLAIGVGASLAAALVGAWGAVMRAVRLPPAEAMRPEPPARFRPTVIERLGFQRWLSIAERMIVRNVERRPWKALLSMTGIALAVAILVAGRFGMDALDYIMDLQFRAAQREDAMVEFTDPRSADARHAVRNLPGVTAAEPFRYIPVKLRFGHRERRAGILALAPAGDLRAVLDVDYRRHWPPEEGLLMSAKLARSLGVAAGDRVAVEVLEGKRVRAEVPVAGLVDELIGVNVYMSLPAASRLLGEGGAVSGAMVTIDAARRGDFYAEVKRTPAIRGTSVKEAMLANFRDVIARSLFIQTMMNIVFASVIAFGVVYNSVRVALSERGHELASLRVLGFTRREIGAMLLGEQALLTLAAIPFGFLIGYGICAAVAAAINATQETFRMPLVLSAHTFAFAFVVVAAAAVFSGLLVWGRLRRLDLVAVLKTRE
jgi:putative ABC transport system permease protein